MYASAQTVAAGVPRLAIELRRSMPNLVYLYALQRAAEILGGEDALAARLRIPSQHLRLWTRGYAPVPPDIFLRVVDILVELPVDHSVAHSTRVSRDV